MKVNKAEVAAQNTVLCLCIVLGIYFFARGVVLPPRRYLPDWLRLFYLQLLRFREVKCKISAAGRHRLQLRRPTLVKRHPPR